MVIQINPFQQQIWRSISRLQIGLGADFVVLENLSQAQERFVASLAAGIAEAQIEPLAKLLKMQAGDANQLVSALEPVLLKKIMSEPSEQDSKNANLVSATLTNNTDGFEVLERRNLKTVYLNELGSAGVSIAMALAKLGIGIISSSDSSKVNQEDLEEYLKSLEGCQKIAALNYQFEQFGLRSTAVSKSFDKASVAVLTAQQCLYPAVYAPILNREIPHLSVVFDQRGVTVSPLVLPGETPCLYCFELEKITTDSDWPVLASQLISNKIQFDDSASRSFAAARVASIVSKWIDRQEVESIGIKLDRFTGQTSNFEIRANADCDCLLQRRLEQIEKPRALAS